MMTLHFQTSDDDSLSSSTISRSTTPQTEMPPPTNSNTNRRARKRAHSSTAASEVFGDMGASIRSLLEHKQQKQNQAVNEYSHFGANVANQIQAMETPYQRSTAMVKIQEVLHNITFNFNNYMSPPIQPQHQYSHQPTTIISQPTAISQPQPHFQLPPNPQPQPIPGTSTNTQQLPMPTAPQTISGSPNFATTSSQDDLHFTNL